MYKKIPILLSYLLLLSPAVSRYHAAHDSGSQPSGHYLVGSGLTQPIGIVFLGPNDAFVLEKASGQVKRVISGVIQPTPVLDLAVNSNSERGLLSLVLHPNFPATPFVYIRWTESSTGADSTRRRRGPAAGQPGRSLHLERHPRSRSTAI